MTMAARAGVLTISAVSVLAIPATAQRAGEANPRYLEQRNPRAWIMTTELVVKGYDNARNRPARGELVIDQWKIDKLAVVYPMAPSSASHELDPRRSGGEMQLDDRTVDDSPRMLSDFPSGAQYAVWDFAAEPNTEYLAREMELLVSAHVISYETVYHEAEAMKVEWPKSKFPDVAESTFAPTPFLDHDPSGPYDMGPVQDLVKEWTDGQDPRNVRPAQLAKWLAGNVMQHVQLSGQGLAFGRNGLFEGVALQPPPETARRRRGSPFDMVMLLTAVYREAGLPARTVIGFGLEDEDDEKLEFLKGKEDKVLRAWTEFCLYDEADGTVTWIPVDIVSMRERSSRMPRGFMEREQKYFGTHDELDSVVPFTFHVFPPTTVRSYSASNAPGFWGWLMFPASPERAFQSLRFQLGSAPNRGGEQRGGR